MQVISLIKKEKPDFDETNLGNELGEGADGQCFELINDHNKVIKYSVIYEYYFKNNISLEYLNFKNNLDVIINNYPKYPFVVKIFNHEFFFQGKRKIVNNEDQNYIIHYTVMERLRKLSNDEEKVFSSLIYREHGFWEKKFLNKDLNEILAGLSKGLEFDLVKVKAFCKKVRDSNIQHNDINTGNIMKNATGDFKLVDLDRFSIKK